MSRKHERQQQYDAARLRCNDARIWVGVEDHEAPAVRVYAPNPFEEGAAAVLACSACEESAWADGDDDEAHRLQLFWLAHRDCKPENPCDAVFTRRVVRDGRW